MSAGSSTARERIGRWWRGRFGRRLVLEALLLATLLTLYRLGRYLGRDQVDEALRNARSVIELERRLSIGNEQGFQDLMLQHQIVIRFLNRYYALVHFPATVAFVVLTYVKAPEVYARIRFVFVSVTAAALVTQILYPLAPPRMMPGFIDTIARWGPAIYTRPGVESVANQYAAMPSLHVGWAVIIGYGMLRITDRPWRWIGVAHVVITMVAVVGTANHYWVDALVAVGMVVAAVRLSERIAPKPVEALALATGRTAGSVPDR